MDQERGAHGGQPIVTDPETGVVRTATAAEEKRIEGDGIVPDPSQATADFLWKMKTGILCVALLILVGTLAYMVFIPKEPAGSADAAIIVAVIGILVNELGRNFNRGGRS